MELSSYVVEISKNPPKELPINPQKANDPFYLYKMRQLVVQVVGKGKMIKTSMTNLNDVATDLQVPPDYIPHFFGKTIGATAKYDPSKPERERGSISGEYDMKDLSEVLLKFVKSFVLCPGCNYPEFRYSPASKNVRIKCKSCGWKADVASMELNEKFKRYVINNPPPKPPKIAKPQGTGERRGKKPATNGAQIGKDDWSGDTSKEAVKKRMDAMVPTNLQAMIASPDGGEANIVDIIKKYACSHKPDETEAEIVRLATSFGLENNKRTELIVESLLYDVKSIGSQITVHKTVIAKLVTNVKGQQELFLDALENLYLKEQQSDTKNIFKTKFKDVLYLLHNEDLLDDEVVFKWYNKQKGQDGKDLRAAVASFVTWLKEAEEEDSDDSDEEVASVNGNGKKVEVPKDETSIDDEIDAL